MALSRTAVSSRAMSLVAPRVSSALSSVSSASNVAQLQSAPGPKVGIGAAIFCAADEGIGWERKVLLAQRGQAPNKGKWTFPGGKLEFGESLTACAAREVKEETGLSVDVLDQPFWTGDLIMHNNVGKPVGHYVIIDFVAWCKNFSSLNCSTGLKVPSAMSDVDQVKWVRAGDVGNSEEWKDENLSGPISYALKLALQQLGEVDTSA